MYVQQWELSAIYADGSPSGMGEKNPTQTTQHAATVALHVVGMDGAQRGLWFAVSAPAWLFQLKLRGRCPFTTRAPGGGEVKLWLRRTGLSSQRSAADGGRMEHANRKRQ